MPRPTRILIAAIATLVLVCMPNAWLQIGLILGGALAGWQLKPGESPATSASPIQRSGHRIPLAILTLFAVLLVALPLLASAFGNRDLALFDSFYRAGSVVFGGGHVVLPLLQSEVVPPGWVGNDAFLAGYGAAQAIPGPLFTFSSYLGTLARPGEHAWWGGLICLIALFLPGWLLMAGALPFWEKLRAKAAAQFALRGANAAVVGILAAALYHPVATSSIFTAADLLHAAIGFALLKWTPCPPWLLVIASAACGQWLR